MKGVGSQPREGRQILAASVSWRFEFVRSRNPGGVKEAVADSSSHTGHSYPVVNFT